MKTINEIALATKFPQETISSLIEIVNATVNPTVAMETLLGIYTEPTISQVKTDTDKLLFFISYNKWDDRVSYYYNDYDSKHIYVSKDTDSNLINEDNYKDFEVKYSSNNCYGFRVKLSTMKRYEGYEYLESWNRRPDAEV
jgi:hypothetical protein